MKKLEPAKEYASFTQLEADIYSVMSNAQGRAVVSFFLTLCAVNQSAYCAGDPHGSSFLEGSQAPGYALVAKLKELCPEHYLTMLREEIENDGQHNRNQQPNNGIDDSGDIANAFGANIRFDR